MAFERGGIRRWTARTLKSHNLWPAWIHFRESGVTRPSGGDLADCRCQADFPVLIPPNFLEGRFWPMSEWATIHPKLPESKHLAAAPGPANVSNGRHEAILAETVAAQACGLGTLQCHCANLTFHSAQAGCGFAGVGLCIRFKSGGKRQ